VHEGETGTGGAQGVDRRLRIRNQRHTRMGHGPIIAAAGTECPPRSDDPLLTSWRKPCWSVTHHDTGRPGTSP
jgi:hypothetical protein